MAYNFCERCGSKLVAGNEHCPKCSGRVRVVAAPAEVRSRQTKEYKIIGTEEAMDISGGGKVNKHAMEKILNTYARDGWCLKDTITRQLPGLASITYESILILEREIPQD